MKMERTRKHSKRSPFFPLFSWSSDCSILCLNMIFLTGGVVSTLTFTLIMQLSQHAPSHCQASHYTVITSADVLGKLLFSAVFGALIQWTSYPFVFAIFSALSALAIVVIMYAPTSISTLWCWFNHIFDLSVIRCIVPHLLAPTCSHFCVGSDMV